jgi:hypothetical protein
MTKPKHSPQDEPGFDAFDEALEELEDSYQQESAGVAEDFSIALEELTQERTNSKSSGTAGDRIAPGSRGRFLNTIPSASSAPNGTARPDAETSLSTLALTLIPSAWACSRVCSLNSAVYCCFGIVYNSHHPSGLDATNRLLEDEKRRAAQTSANLHSRNHASNNIFKGKAGTEMAKLANFCQKVIFHSLAAGFVALAACCNAATFRIPQDGTNLNIILNGAIEDGDAEKLAKILISSERRAEPILRVDLNSPGGNVAEAIRIADLVKTFHLMTLVQGGGYCASSCFFVWLAGTERAASGIPPNGELIASDLGYVGLHRPYFSKNAVASETYDDAAKNQEQAMKMVRSYLQSENVPQRLIDELISHPSSDIYWMTPDDIRLLGEERPEFQEVAIANCGYDRDLPYEEFNAQLSGNGERLNELKKKVADQNECIYRKITAPFITQKDGYVDRIDKLTMGWRPWDKQN